jgi:hypothetical protein
MFLVAFRNFANELKKSESIVKAKVKQTLYRPGQALKFPKE